MHRFWKHVIEPFLTIVHPRMLVEIGASNGDNSKNIARWCFDNDAHAHIIDPAPGFNFADLQNQFPGRLTCHEALSLDVLPSLGNVDIALIDGDHNWYTVYSELQGLYEIAVTADNFPLTFLHDVGWPYARRDMYYAPSTVPAEGRLPYAVGGIDPVSGLIAEGEGINTAYAHALKEGGEKNGVLTAVEDFIHEKGEGLRLLLIPLLNGLGIIYPEKLLNIPEFASLVQVLQFNPTQQALLEHADKERLMLSLEIEALQNSALAMSSDQQSSRVQLMEMSDWATRLQTQLAERHDEVRALQLQQEEKDIEAQALQARLVEKDIDARALLEEMAAVKNESAEMSSRLRVVDETPILYFLEQFVVNLREHGLWGALRLAAHRPVGG